MDYLTIKEESHPFWYSLKAQRELFKNTDAAEDDVYLIWLGLKYGAIAEKKKFELTENQLLEFYDLNLDAFSVAHNLLQSHLGKLKAARGES